MEQTKQVKCPSCNVIQSEDIDDLVLDTAQMEGSFPKKCESCRKNFIVKFEYKPYIKTIPIQR